LSSCLRLVAGLLNTVKRSIDPVENDRCFTFLEASDRSIPLVVNEATTSARIKADVRRSRNVNGISYIKTVLHRVDLWNKTYCPCTISC